MGKTLFDKIWDAHVVSHIEDGPDMLYIDRHYCHEVTSPQAFEGLRRRGIGVMRPDRTVCAPDHNIPTHDRDLPIADPVSRHQVETLEANAKANGLRHFGPSHERNGIIHVIGPENGFTLPGMTIVCGDSHTSTHGALGAVAFGIGTSEVEMVLASQCIIQPRPKTMRITVNGTLRPGVSAKDMALYIISKLTTGGATGHFVEYAGEAVRGLSMEGRMTLCNMSIEMGARGGMVAPDHTTIEYVRGRDFAPAGEDFDRAAAKWLALASDDDAVFDREVVFDAADIAPMVTYGTNPGMGMPIDGTIPGPPVVRQGARIHGIRARREDGGQEGRLCLLGQLHQRPHRRLQGIRLDSQGSPQGPGRDGVAGAGVKQSEKTDHSRGSGQDTRGGRF